MLFFKKHFCLSTERLMTLNTSADRRKNTSPATLDSASPKNKGKKLLTTPNSHLLISRAGTADRKQKNRYLKLKKFVENFLFKTKMLSIVAPPRQIVSPITSEKIPMNCVKMSTLKTKKTAPTM